MLLFMFAFCIWGAIQAGVDLSTTDNKPLMIACVVILAFLALTALGFGVFVTMLTFTHMTLIARNQTTNEFIKTMDDEENLNPFQR